MSVWLVNLLVAHLSRAMSTAVGKNAWMRNDANMMWLLDVVGHHLRIIRLKKELHASRRQLCEKAVG